MDKKIKKLWVKALRSGEYEQGASYLRRNGKHSCLGVLCEVIGVPIHYDEKVLRLAVARRAGLMYVTGLIKNMELSPNKIDLQGRDGVTLSVAALNDAGFTFGQIADVIECFL